jgi:uncharacterized membrane protein
MEPVEADQAPASLAGMSIPQLVAHLRFDDHAGPLPNPDLLVAYEQIVSGAARQLMDDFLVEGEHRRAIQKQVVDDSSVAVRRGQVLAFLLVLVLIGIGSAATFTDHEAVAGIIFAGGIAAVASTFIASKVTQGRLARSQSPTPPSD